jgi:hypothetical protein
MGLENEIKLRPRCDYILTATAACVKPHPNSKHRGTLIAKRCITRSSGEYLQTEPYEVNYYKMRLPSYATMRGLYS